MTDNDFMRESEVEKQLKWLMFNFPKVEKPQNDADKLCNCVNLYCQNALALLRHKIELLAQIQFTLSGVMHYVDKWLEGDELEQDEVVRAETMRKKTLQILEKQQTEIKRLERLAEYYAAKDTIAEIEEEISSEAIKEFAERLKEKFCEPYDYNSSYMQGVINNLVKEMAEG